MLLHVLGCVRVQHDAEWDERTTALRIIFRVCGWLLSVSMVSGDKEKKRNEEESLIPKKGRKKVPSSTAVLLPSCLLMALPTYLHVNKQKRRFFLFLSPTLIHDTDLLWSNSSFLSFLVWFDWIMDDIFLHKFPGCFSPFPSLRYKFPPREFQTQFNLASKLIFILNCIEGKLVWIAG